MVLELLHNGIVLETTTKVKISVATLTPQKSPVGKKKKIIDALISDTFLGNMPNVLRQEDSSLSHFAAVRLTMNQLGLQERAAPVKKMF